MANILRYITERAGQEVYQNEDYRFLVKTRTDSPAYYFYRYFNSKGFIDMMKKLEDEFTTFYSSKTILRPRFIFLDDKNASNTARMGCEFFFENQELNNFDEQNILGRNNHSYWVDEFGYELDFKLNLAWIHSDWFNSNSEEYYRDYKYKHGWVPIH